MELLSNNPDYTERDTVNELEMISLLKKSFVFVPTVGMRLAPEIILLELYREIFFEHRSPETSIKDLIPGSGEYSEYEKIVLDALRGRDRKRTKSMQAKPFYAPAYPSLARYAWPRKKEAGVVNALLLKGPISTHLWCGGVNDEKKELHEKLINELFLSIKSFKEFNSIVFFRLTNVSLFFLIILSRTFSDILNFFQMFYSFSR